MNPVSAFNSQLSDFITFVIQICPTHTEAFANIKTDIVSYRGLIDGALKLNNLIGIEKFILHILEYEDKINAKDCSFFLSKNYGQSEGGTDVSMLEAMKFKLIWNDISEKNRDKICDFIIVLTYWARQYFNNQFK